MKTFSIILLTLTFGFAPVNALAQPQNDLIENAIDLDSGPFPYSELSVNFSDATNTNDPTGNPSCDLVHPGIWYKFTANNTGTVEAIIVNPANPWVIFFSAADENAIDGSELTHIDVPTNSCGNGASKTIETEPGTTYYIYMKNTLTSNVLINIAPAMVPANDLIVNARNLNGLEEYTDEDIVFQLASTTNDGGLINCNTGAVKAVWYKFTAPVDGQVVAGIGIPQDEGGVMFFSAANENATSGAELTLVDQPTNDCATNNLQSIIATEGTTYYIFAALINEASVSRATVSINLSGILGTEENTIDGFDFYPNPVTNELNLSAKSTIDEIGIFNLMGQKVVSEKPRAAKTSIDLGHLSTGLYVMNVVSGGVSGTYKLIKK